MKKIIPYIRISDKDQSNFSLDGQMQMISNYAERNNYVIEETFVDDGFSAKNFDRPDWKKLEDFVRKNHSSVDYLVVVKYDRFSRNTLEALKMIELIENKFKIRIMSVMEPIPVHGDSPFFFQMRTQILTNAQVEWMIIRDRTRFGIHYAAKAGRFCSTAPIGYKNARDEKDKPILVVNETMAPVIRMMYQMCLQGASLKEISLAAKRRGYKNRGHSAIKATLQNPVYAGMIKVPAYFEDPGGWLTKGIHQGIVDQSTWYRVQGILEPRKNNRTVMNEQVPLRSVLKCFCGRAMTAGNSKGRKRYYWYYRCDDHTNINLNADKLHAQMEELIGSLSLPDHHVEYLQKKILENLQEKSRDQEFVLHEKKREVAALQVKLESVEEKFIGNELDAAAYKKWKNRYQQEIAVCQRYIGEYAQPLERVMQVYRERIPYLGKMNVIWDKADLHCKQAIVRQVFKSTLYYQDNIYRTAYLLACFQPKAALLKEKGLLLIEQPIQKIAESQYCAPDGSSLEPLCTFLELLAQINCA